MSDDHSSAADPSTGCDGSGELPAVVASLADGGLAAAPRRRLLRRLIRADIAPRRPQYLLAPRTAARWLAAAVMDVAPHIPVRTLPTLRSHHDGLRGDALAERLVRNAARATAGIGATSGGAAAVEWVVTPTLLSAPVLLAAETVAVVAVEMKLIAELHEVYGRPLPGTGGQRAAALAQSWAHQRGVNPLVPTVVLGTAARRELRDRLLRRFGRNLSTLGPLLTGAAVAGYLNRRATRSLGRRIMTDLASSGS